VPRRRRHPSYQRGPTWLDRLWLLLGLLILLGLVAFIGYRIIGHFVYEELPANELLSLGIEAEAQGQYAKAKEYYQRILRVYRGTTEGDMARERLQRIAERQEWDFMRKRMWLVEAELKQAGRYDAARDILAFIEKHWPEQQDKEALDEERKEIDDLERLQQDIPPDVGNDADTSPSSS
jgi:tetratricopeptide (TPR) repeat protein